jgi:hypothetical protein
MVAMFCPHREGGSECEGNKLASEMETTEERQGRVVIFMGQGDREERGLVGIKMVVGEVLFKVFGYKKGVDGAPS